MKHGSRNAWCAAAVVLVALVTTLPVEAAWYPRNEFAPVSGATCRDACGPDCPSGCDTWRYKECIDDRRYRHVTRYTCGVHQGCRMHDACLDKCAAAGVPQVDEEFLTADCNRTCHEEAVAWATERFGVIDGPIAALSWVAGRGPQSSKGIWEYTKDSPEGPERIGECAECTYCWDNGRCRVRPGQQCEPCLSCGDVHLRTFDGLRYDLQSSGDFILVDSPDGVRVEARQVPSGSGASVNVGAAIRIDGQVVVVGLQPQPTVRIDGTPVALLDDALIPLKGGGEVRRSGRAIVVSSPGGWQMTVRLYGSNLDIAVRHPDALRGRLAGLLGNADGDPANDLLGRDGQKFAIELEEGELYDGFSGSWRLSPEESLLVDLPWPESVQKSGTGRPAVIAKLASFSAEQVQAATDVCVNAGLDPGPRLDICVFDVAVTGDEEMALGAAVSAEGRVDVILRPASDLSAAAAVGITLSAPLEAVAGSQVAVAVTGAVDTGDYVTIVPVGSPDTTRDNHAPPASSGSVALQSPPEPGSFEVRYVRQKDGAVLARRPLEVLPLRVGLAAERRARAGSDLVVRLEGDGYATDLIAIVRAGAPTGDIGNHQRRGGREELQVLVPATPGDYELRYLLDQRRHLVTAQPLQVEDVQVQLQAPDRAAAGSSVSVQIVGESNEGDLIVVVAAGAPDAEIGAHARIPAGAQEVTVRRLSPTSGAYEIRYVIDQGRRVVARRPLQLD